MKRMSLLYCALPFLFAFIAYFIVSMRTFCSKHFARSEDSWCHDLYLVQKFMPLLLYGMLHLPKIISDFGVSEYTTALRWLTMTDAINFTYFSPYGLTSDVLVGNHYIEGAHVFTYTPRNLSNIGPQPVLLYFHGGGSVLSSAANFDLACRYMAVEIGIKVIQVDYVKSPEVLFPGPQEQGLKVLMKLMRGRIRDVDPRKIIIAGDSFGGHMSAYICIKWKERGYDRKYHPLFYQILLYPLLQFVNLNLDSYKLYRNQEAFLKTCVLTHMLSLHVAGDLSLTEQFRSNCLIKYHPDVDTLIQSHPSLFRNVDLVFFNACSNHYPHSYYSHYARLISDPSLTLLFKKDLSGLPPTLLVIPEYDMLRDDAILFSESLEQSGVQVRKYIAKDMFHAFMVLLNEYKLYHGAVLAYREMKEAIRERIQDEKVVQVSNIQDN